MARRAVSPATLTPEPRAREGRLFCGVAGCDKGYIAWMHCVAPGCPSVTDLVERPATETTAPPPKAPS